MGKWHLLPCNCRYFYRTFTEMFLEWSFIMQMIFLPSAHFDWNQNAKHKKKKKKKKKKKIFKNHLRNHMEYNTCFCISLYIFIYLFFFFFFCYSSKTLVAMVTYTCHGLIKGKSKTKWYLLLS